MPRRFLRLLGSVHLADSDGVTSTHRGRAATVLSLLGMECGRVVSFDRLVEELWGDEAPPSARSTVYALVSRLRAQLRGSDVRIVATAAGYVLEAPPGTVDALELVDLVAGAEEAAAARDPHQVLARSAAARALWRGEPFTDAVVRDVLGNDARKLTDLVDRADELSAEALLAVGRGVEAGRLAGGLLERDRFNESYWRLRMRAEHASGRTAAALDTFAELRRLLVDELGIEPSDSLSALHLDILRSRHGGDRPTGSRA
ncbi:MAG: BTAD domain-containing putative transcriptional regulator [Aeromicrobium sp.]